MCWEGLLETNELVCEFAYALIPYFLTSVYLKRPDINKVFVDH